MSTVNVVVFLLVSFDFVSYVESQPTVTLDLYIDSTNNASADSGECFVESAPCESLDYAIDIMNSYSIDHVNDITLNAIGDAHVSNYYFWNRSMIIKTGDYDETSFWSINGKSSDKSYLIWENSKVYSNNDYHYNFTISKFTVCDQCIDFNSSSSNEYTDNTNSFWKTDGMVLGSQSLTLNDMIFANLSRNGIFLYNYLTSPSSGHATGNGAASVFLINSVFKDCVFNHQFFRSQYSGVISMYNVVFENNYFADTFAGMCQDYIYTYNFVVYFE